MTPLLTVLNGDSLTQLATLSDQSVQCCVTSPPYWGLRDYGTAKWEGGDDFCEHEASERYYTEKTAALTGVAGASWNGGEANKERLKKGRWRESGQCTKCGSLRIDPQIGLEKSPQEYVANLVQVFREVRRVLAPTGSLWINIGDSYSAGGNGGGGNWMASKVVWATKAGRRGFRAAPDGWKRKELMLIPFMVATALSADGWYLRASIIWSKPGPQEPPREDRPPQSHEHIFLFASTDQSDCDGDQLRDGTVWRITPGGGDTGHSAVMPSTLAKRCILAGSKAGDTILDPFGGSGTTGMVALELGRKAVLIELNPEYCKLIERRCDVTPGLALV